VKRAGAQLDVDRVLTVWRDCLASSGGPFLFAEETMADAMYAPVCTRLATYDLAIDPACRAYSDRILALPSMVEWTKAALLEPDEVEELDVAF
jgi:glutathione S-transferase